MKNHPVFLLFQSHRKGSYLHDAEISIMSGQLLEAGVENVIVETILEGEDHSANRELIERLAERIVDCRYNLLIIARLWDPEVIWKLREALANLDYSDYRVVFLPHKAHGENVEPYDYVVPTMDWRVLRMLIEAESSAAMERIPNLLIREGEELRASSAQERLSEESVDRWTLRPNFRREIVSKGPRPKSTHLVVYGNPGCPYRRSIREVPVWQDLELNESETNTKGCSFCNINLSEDYRFVKGMARHVIEQLLNIRHNLPEAEDIILLDQDPFPYLVEVFEGLGQEGVQGMHVLIQARADLFLKRRVAFEKALELARETGQRCTPFLVGIENFHQETLDFYNKGVTVETNIEILRYLADLVRRFPDVVEANHISPGFILWHPWVSFESLRTNVDAIQHHGFLNFRSEVALSKIRLYPDIPFYWKARKEGLLDEGYADVGLDSSRRYGYPEEAPYRFSHPESQIAYTLLAGLCRKHEPIEEIKLLGLILDWVEGRESEWPADQKEALEHPDQLVERFEAEHLGAILSLKKIRSGQRQSQRLSEQALADILETIPALRPENLEAVAGYQLAFATGDSQVLTFFFGRADDLALIQSQPHKADFRVQLSPHNDSPHYKRIAHWQLSYANRDKDPARQPAIEAVIGAITPALEHLPLP